MILDRWYDQHGDLYRVGKEGGQHFTETIGEAFTPQAGKVTRQYVSRLEAVAFDPDPCGELQYQDTPETF